MLDEDKDQGQLIMIECVLFSLGFEFSILGLGMDVREMWNVKCEERGDDINITIRIS